MLETFVLLLLMLIRQRRLVGKRKYHNWFYLLRSNRFQRWWGYPIYHRLKTPDIWYLWCHSLTKWALSFTKHLPFQPPWSRKLWDTCQRFRHPALLCRRYASRRLGVRNRFYSCPRQCYCSCFMLRPADTFQRHLHSPWPIRSLVKIAHPLQLMHQIHRPYMSGSRRW